ncbi:MAG: glycosyltransferase family 39 protein [Bryobacteraceae bacterium]
MTGSRRTTALFFAALFAAMLALRLCHSHILWADEDYHLAAGLQTLHGKVLYRDLWYDKPPLAAWLYASLGALPGWPLRLFDAVWLLAICAAAWRFARDLWGQYEAFLAAALMAFFLNFDFPSAVIPAAPDLLLLLPHIAAVHCAWKRRPFWSGLCCGIGFLFHTKAVFVLAVCAAVAWPALPLLLVGFVIPNAAVFAVLGVAGALPDYLLQVWRWGFAYAGSSSEPQPVLNALRRVFDWSGFHAALVAGALAWFFSGPDDRFSSSDAPRAHTRLQFAGWLAIGFLGVSLGGRFFPRYFFLILPPLVLISARALARRKAVALVAAIALLIPFVRFAPRYFTLAFHPAAPWADIALDQDTQAAAALVNARKQPGDTLFVWGYRPGLFVYTRLPVDSRYWDSQPLTGVPADRHLRDAVSLIPDWAAHNRVELAATHPAFIVDSLSLANPRLALESYPELRAWLAGYGMVARTRLSLIYQRLIYRNKASAPR